MEQAYQLLNNENSDLQRRLSEYENKLGLLSQEVQRLNELLKGVNN